MDAPAVKDALASIGAGAVVVAILGGLFLAIIISAMKANEGTDRPDPHDPV